MTHSVTYCDVLFYVCVAVSQTCNPSYFGVRTKKQKSEYHKKKKKSGFFSNDVFCKLKKKTNKYT